MANTEIIGPKMSTLSIHEGANFVIRDSGEQYVTFTHFWLPVAVAVVGWGITVWAQRNTLKEQLANQIKYDIYKQIIGIKKEMQDSLNKLGTFKIPFTVMDSFLLIPALEGVDPLKSGWDYWNSQVKELTDSYFQFQTHYTQFLGVVESWDAPLRQLRHPLGVLWDAVQTRSNDIFNVALDLKIISSKQGWDWRKHDRADLDKKFADLSIKSLDINLYINDFVILIHNELLADYFDEKIPTRVPGGGHPQVLTVAGLVTQEEIF